MKSNCIALRSTVAAVTLFSCLSASAIESGFGLRSHPGGNQAPSIYGLRIDNTAAPDPHNTWIFPQLRQLSFTYYGLGRVPGDLWITFDNPSATHPEERGGYGTLGITGITYELATKSNGTFSSRMGDENNDEGHRGHNGISGWGRFWFRQLGNTERNSRSDFLFTAKIPDGGSMILMFGGAVATIGFVRYRIK